MRILPQRETLDRLGQMVERGCVLLGAVADVFTGVGLAIVTGAISVLPDAQLGRAAEYGCQTCSTLPAEGARAILLVLVVSGTVLTVFGCQKTRAWFNRSTEGQP